MPTQAYVLTATPQGDNERWNSTDLYCPCCEAPAVWRSDRRNYYICTKCHHGFVYMIRADNSELAEAVLAAYEAQA